MINQDDDFDSMTFADNDSFIDLRSPAPTSSSFFLDLSVSPSPARRQRSNTADSDDSQRPLRPMPPKRDAKNIRVVTDPLAPPPRRDSASASSSGKSLPALPKPSSFARPSSAGPSSAPRRPSPSAPLEPMPPTTNLLNAQERAELVRKSRKLTQLFGVTPSLADASQTPFDPRRFSAPPSPHESNSLVNILSAEELRAFAAPTRRHRPSRHKSADPSSRSDADALSDRLSFMDLSDEELVDDRLHHHQLRSPSPSPSQLSFVSISTTSILTIDLERDRRKLQRARLAKLHRFLGSRVPAGLVLGLPPDADLESSLPSPAFEEPTPDSDPRAWKRLRRRSSSAAEMKTRWFDDGVRVKAELDEREKAINVRRALKMEKLFGVPPPQTLYHTRPAPLSSSAVPHLDPSPVPSPTSASRNINQTAYIGKGKGTRRLSTRSAASESTTGLLADNHDPFDDVHALARRASSIYMQYRHSLNSLGDIIDRADKESIAEIHQYLTHTGDLTPVGSDNDDDDPAGPPPDDAPSTTPTTSTTNADLRALRRRSLPTRASSLSLASQYSISPPAPQSFQVRRRRAAKLTHFFGVDYRDLIGDILESIEHDVQEERSCGALEPEEAQDLLQKLRKLRTKRSGIA